MIDWINLLFSSLWILGFSIILSALSYTNWISKTSGINLWPALQAPSFLVWFWLGLSLASIGFAGTSISMWEQVIWSVLALGNIYYSYEAWSSYNAKSAE